MRRRGCANNWAVSVGTTSLCEKENRNGLRLFLKVGWISTCASTKGSSSSARGPCNCWAVQWGCWSSPRTQSKTFPGLFPDHQRAVAVFLERAWGRLLRQKNKVDGNEKGERRGWAAQLQHEHASGHFPKHNVLQQAAAASSSACLHSKSVSMCRGVSHTSLTESHVFTRRSLTQTGDNHPPQTQTVGNCQITPQNRISQKLSFELSSAWFETGGGAVGCEANAFCCKDQ